MIFRSFKKLAALMLAALTVLSIVPISAFAAEGDAVTITFHRACDAEGNPMFYNGEAIINGYHAGGIGEPKFRMFVDGSTAFCLEPGVPLHTGDTLMRVHRRYGTLFQPVRKKPWGLHFCTAIRETATASPAATMKSEWQRRHFFGSLLSDAETPPRRMNRRATPPISFTTAKTTPTRDQERYMTRSWRF